MNKNSQNDMYDINKYTDEELFNILDVNSPTDRELEARILFLVNRYENMQNKSGDELATFFKQIYNHFFDASDDEDEIIEGFGGNTETGNTHTNAEYALYEYSGKDDPNSVIVNGNKKIVGDMDLGNAANTISAVSALRENKLLDPLKYYNAPTSSQLINIDEATNEIKHRNMGNMVEQRKDDIGFTKPLEYAKDKLNPLLQQTIKRVISIDSQYRDNKTTFSTDFTFNLSDPLKDVVSLKLYSIQIPYTWYTINNNFGSNFFYIKGTSPGINDGTYDYQIDISAGNYSPANLVTAINETIQKTKLIYTDVSFGDTKISYNENTCLSTLKMDITKIYNETSYYLSFPTWSNPNNSSIVNSISNYYRKQSIPGFLGFNFQTYYPNIIYSSTLPKIAATSGDDNGLLNYTIDNSNNYLTIIKYIGPNEYTSQSVIDTSFQIKFTLSNGTYSRNQIVSDLSAQLTNHPYLINSSISRIDIVDPSLNDPSLVGVGSSHFQLSIRFNRSTTNNIENSKAIVIFPTETTQTKIWTGSNSCFRFTSVNSELNNIYAETPIIKQQESTTLVQTQPYIYLKCKAAGYDLTQNDYKITVANSSSVGYSLTEHIAAINNGIVSTNNTTKTVKNTNGDFNIDTTKTYIDNNSKFNISLDINKKFITDMYYLDLTGGILNNILNLSGQYLNGVSDLSGSGYTFSSTFLQNGSGYTTNSNYILKIYPSLLNYGNQNSGSITLPIPNGYTYSTFGDLQTAINNAFENYTDSNGSYILSGSNVSFNINTSNTNFVDAIFTISIQKNITQNQYNISFYDSSANDVNGNLISYGNGTWSKLEIDASYCDISGYNLSNILSNTSNSVLTMTNAISSNKIRFNSTNNYFILKPYESGVTSSGGENDIKISIPVNDSEGVPIDYSRDSLLSAINTLLALNPYTVGSSLIINTLNNVEYLKFRVNILKKYTASDFRLVFYDQFSFVKCNAGSTSVKNTTWDTTLGWILGFRNTTVYTLSDYGKNGDIVSLTGDTTVSVNLFNYFLLCLDDFNQNHLNDGLVTLSPKITEISLPSYANKYNYTCDPVTGLITYNANSTDSTSYSKLTKQQLYALTETANSKRSSSVISNSNISAKGYGTGPFVKDVFGLIPIKTAGLANGAVYVDYGGTLQNQERSYFGPVNIHRMSVKLVSDRGDVVDLNGSNWSFSLICEQLYQQKPTNGGKPN